MRYNKHTRVILSLSVLSTACSNTNKWKNVSNAAGQRTKKGSLATPVFQKITNMASGMLSNQPRILRK